MKATITRCLADLVESKFGADKWAAILGDAGLQSQKSILKVATADIPDADVGKLLASTCKVLGINAQQAADAFGEYWCCTYAPRVYSAIVKRYSSAKDMILAMDSVHVDLTSTIPRAHPPRFDYRWENDRTLVVKYKSDRGMIDIFVGLVKGLGKFYKEDLVVRKLSPHQVKVTFG